MYYNRKRHAEEGVSFCMLKLVCKCDVSEEGKRMSKTVVRKNESLEDALRRFKRSVSKTGTLAEAKESASFMKNQV